MSKACARELRDRKEITVNEEKENPAVWWLAARAVCAPLFFTTRPGFLSEFQNLPKPFISHLKYG